MQPVLSESTFGKSGKIILSIIFFSIQYISTSYLYSQQIHSAGKDNKKDSTYDNTAYDEHLDSLNLKISDIIISGNDVTEKDVILREMKLTRGEIYNSQISKEDRESIYRLGLFTNVEISPFLEKDSTILLHVNVGERWYIFPFPEVSMTDGDIRKISVGANVHWANFRGRNENLSLSFGVGYNAFVRAAYSIPWIGGDNIHMFSSVSGSYSIDRNRSLLAQGRLNGSRIFGFHDNGFDYKNYTGKLTIGKYFAKRFSVYTEGGYTFLRVTQDSIGRTISPDGVDKYLLVGFGLNYDTRDSREYALSGYAVHFNYEHFGLLDDNPVNFGRITLEQRGYLPLEVTDGYSITLASRVYTSVAIGPEIPIYNHKFLGYGDEYVRGWAWYGFEGENALTWYNEIRIPILQPNSIKGENIPIVKSLPYLKKFSYKYGLYLTAFYDAGGVWNGNEHLSDVPFMHGAGLGINAILPFGMVGKLEYAYRFAHPTIGQFIIGLGSKF